MASECNVPWRGKGKVQGRVVGETVEARFDALTTQTRRFKQIGADFFRKDLRGVRPRGGPFEVRLTIELTPDAPRHDVDNVAKALLDAMTGTIFHDDSQVVRLTVEKVAGEKARIHVTARPCEEPAPLSLAGPNPSSGPRRGGRR